MQKKKTKPKKRKIPIGKLKTKTAQAFQKLRRLECVDDTGYGNCCTSGERLHWKEGDGGHFIPRGISETLFDERNVHLQCKGDNGFRMKGPAGIHDYSNFIVDMYGQEVLDELLEKEKARRPVKWVRAELEEMLADYEARIKVELERVGE